MEGQTSSRGMSGGRGGMSRTLDGVRVVPLFYKYQLSSDGSTTWRYIDLEVPQASDWGPHLTEMIAHTMSENHTTGLEWKVVYYWSVDNLTWSTPVDLTGTITAAGSLIHSAITAKNTFGLKMRFALAVKNTSPGNVLTATVTCANAFDFRR
jgi:hypothetical protein